MDPHPAPVPARHLYTVKEAAELLHLSRTFVYEQIRAQRLATVTAGRARRVPAIAIQNYVHLLITEAGSEAQHDKAA